MPTSSRHLHQRPRITLVLITLLLGTYQPQHHVGSTLLLDAVLQFRGQFMRNSNVSARQHQTYRSKSLLILLIIFIAAVSPDLLIRKDMKLLCNRDAGLVHDHDLERRNSGGRLDLVGGGFAGKFFQEDLHVGSVGMLLLQW